MVKLEMEALKFTRNLLLTQTDKYLISDYPITSNQLLEVIDYRQKLRDLENNILPICPDFISSNIYQSSVIPN